MKCPAVGKPILAIGHLDERFTPRAKTDDGEPGIGWVDNLRAAEDGHLLLGDYIGVPAWIDKVMASAWPKRSIEGKYNYRCALSHTHDFALEAVSLLGKTRPAIPTLRSLNDVAELYGVDIAAAENHTGDSVYVVVAAAEVHTGAMVALIPAAEDAERLAVEGGEPAEELHLTLAYLGEAADLGARGKQDVIDHVSTVVNGLPRLEAEIFAVSAFNPDHPDRDPCLVWGVTGDMLDAVHDLVDETLHLIDAPIPSQHRPFAAHITAAYTGDLGGLTELAAKVGPVMFDRLRLAFGGEFIDIPLMEWPGEETEPENDATLVAAAAAGANALKSYWTEGAGKKLWVGKPHPWTALFRQLKKHMSVEKAKRAASKWHLEVLGRTPNQKAVKASEPDAISILPAAEPEQPTHEEDPVSLSDDMRSRLGLADDADETAALAAIDALKAKAETPAEPTPEMVAASEAAVKASAEAAEKATKAEAEKDELRKEVTILASQMKSVSDELAAAKAEKAATVKASVFDAALKAGKIKPADREQWETDYDEAPAAVTRVLASIAEGTAVPVAAAGVTGPAEPTLTDDGLGVSDEALSVWASQLGFNSEELTRG